MSWSVKSHSGQSNMEEKMSRSKRGRVSGYGAGIFTTERTRLETEANAVQVNGCRWRRRTPEFPGSHTSSTTTARN